MGEEKEFKIKTSLWNENLENQVKNIELSCQKYTWLTTYMASNISFKYNVLMYMAIVIGPIAGILSSFSEKNNDITMLVTIFSFINGVLSAVIKFGNFEERSLKLKNIAVKYSSLSGNINRQLSLSPNDRVNSGNYLEWISSYYDQLFSETPLIGDEYIEKWKKYSSENNIEPPKTPNTDVKIKIEETASVFLDAKMKYELGRLNSHE
jgi:hypothetical protein